MSRNLPGTSHSLLPASEPALGLRAANTAVTPASFCTFTRKLRHPCSTSSGLAGPCCTLTRLSGLMTTPTRQYRSRIFWIWVTAWAGSEALCASLLSSAVSAAGSGSPRESSASSKRTTCAASGWYSTFATSGRSSARAADENTNIAASAAIKIRRESPRRPGLGWEQSWRENTVPYLEPRPFPGPGNSNVSE